MTTPCIVYIDNTNTLEVTGLTSQVEDEFINDADVTMTVKDADGTEIEGQEWPCEMAYIEDSDGNYRAILKDTLELEDGITYYAHIDADAGSDRIGHWEFAFKAKIRRAS